MLRLVIRVVVALTVVGVLIHEGGQILFAQTKADDVAQRAAQVGAETFVGTKNVTRARLDAAAEAKSAGARLRAFRMDPEGRATVRVAITASTLIVRRVS